MSNIKRSIFVLVVLTFFAAAGCVSTTDDSANTTNTPVGESAQTAQNTQEENTMKLTIGEYNFTVILEENETAAKLKEKLPLKLTMSELNGNEKYNYLPFSLPADSFSPGNIEEGDVMLYGDSCLVVFYKSFQTSYSYTKIGHIENTADLQKAVGTGSIEMKFER